MLCFFGSVCSTNLPTSQAHSLATCQRPTLLPYIYIYIYMFSTVSVCCGPFILLPITVGPLLLENGCGAFAIIWHDMICHVGHGLKRYNTNLHLPSSAQDRGRVRAPNVDNTGHTFLPLSSPLWHLHSYTDKNIRTTLNRLRPITWARTTAHNMKPDPVS